MQDKLGELKKIAIQKNIAYANNIPNTSYIFSEKNDFTENDGKKIGGREGGGGGNDVHINIQNHADMDDIDKMQDKEFMREYFSKIEVIKNAMSEMENLVEKIKELKMLSLRAISPQQEKQISQELNRVLDATNMLTTKTKKALERIKEENDIKNAKEENEKNIAASSSETRIRTNIYNSIVFKFREILLSYQTIQTELKHDVKNKVTRQIKFVYPEASDEKVEELIDRGDMSSAAAIRTQISGEHESLRNAIADIEDKYRDIKKLQQSVQELHDMFVEMAHLIEHQGELINQIEFSVNQAKDYTEKAEAELVTARKYQQKTKKRMCWISVCLLFLIVIILVPVLITVLK